MSEAKQGPQADTGVKESRGRGARAVVHQAVDGVVALVEEGHASASRGVLRVANVLGTAGALVVEVESARMRAVRGVLSTVKAVNRGVQAAVDAVVAAVAGEDQERPANPAHGELALPMRSDVLGSAPWLLDAGVGALNGVVGDWLHHSANGLSLPMALRAGDSYVPLEPSALKIALPNPSARVVIFVHGLGATDWSWSLNAEQYHGHAGACFGTMLERDLGVTSLYVRYNSGRSIADNGHELAQTLERLCRAYPAPLHELILVGHSMGGLVVRAACAVAEREHLAWTLLVQRVLYLGSPHHGAPLAKLAHVAGQTLGAIDFPATRVISGILAQRSLGIRMLRSGTVSEPPHAADPPLLASARHIFISTTVTRDAHNFAGWLLGDLLVRAPSASGSRLEHEGFSIEQVHLGGVLHHHMQNHPAVYAEVLEACREQCPAGVRKTERA
jgi:pimeloyl-ACP methyl ester carboxylesterase